MNEFKYLVRGFLHKLLFISFWILILLNLPHLCNAHNEHHHHSHGESPSFKYSKQANEPYKQKVDHHEEDWSVWTQALGSTLLISAAPFLILFFVPLDKSKEKEPLLKILLSFASGGLLGDSFLHLIPHALSPHSHDEESAEHHHNGHEHEHDHSHSHVGFFVLLGILIFLVVEKSVRLVNTGHSHSHKVDSKSSKKVSHEKGDFAKHENSLKKENSKKQKQKGNYFSVFILIRKSKEFVLEKSYYFQG